MHCGKSIKCKMLPPSEVKFLVSAPYYTFSIEKIIEAVKQFITPTLIKQIATTTPQRLLQIQKRRGQKTDF